MRQDRNYGTIKLGRKMLIYFYSNRPKTCRKSYAETLCIEIPTEECCFLPFSELFVNIPNVKPVGERS